MKNAVPLQKNSVQMAVSNKLNSGKALDLVGPDLTLTLTLLRGWILNDYGLLWWLSE